MRPDRVAPTMLSSVVPRLLDVLYPPRCVGLRCGERGVWLCDSCAERIETVPGNVCVRCGVRVGAPKTCRACMASPPSYRRATSAGRHTAVLRRAIHVLKYRGVRGIAGPLGCLAAQAYGAADPMLVVVPVPSRRRRISVRGVDHARLIAVAVAREMAADLQHGVLRRVRSTQPQVGLEPSERWVNVAGAFAADAEARDRSFVVVDDVLTTGATAEACAEALMRAGARQVDVCTVARATLRHPSRGAGRGKRPDRHRVRGRG